MASGNLEWRSDDLGSARILDLRGGRLRAHVMGDGPVVVLVHGVLVNANLWRKVVPRPRHPKGDEAVREAFKKSYRRRSRTK